MIDKAVILARGLGTRMQRETEGVQLDEQTQQLASQGVKALIPVAGRAFLDYVMENLIRAGYTRLCLVVAPDNTAIRDYYGARAEGLARLGVAVHFANQLEPKGTADAVAAAREFAGDDSFCMINCDNLYPVNDLKALREAEGGSCYCIAHERAGLIAHSNIPPDRIARFAVVDVDEGWNLRRIVEKPDNPEAFAVGGKVYVSMSCFRFTSHIFEACAHIAPHPVRKELEVTSAIQCVIDHQLAPFKVIPSSEGVLDLTGRADIEGVRRMVEGMRLEW